jgi:hypothetical protein
MQYLVALDSTDGDIDGMNSSFRCTVKEGDWAVGASPRDEFSQNLFGNCLPHFFAVKLAEEPPEDGNDDQEFATDVNVLCEQMLDWEVRDRAMAPGYADEQTSTAVCDDVTSLMDFTYENLNLKAHGQRWICPVPGSVVVRGVQYGRADLPQGYGPMVRTVIAADTWNRMAANVNLLTKVRFMGYIFTVATQLRSGVKSSPIAASWGDDCGQGSQAVFQGVGFETPALASVGPGPGPDADGTTLIAASASVSVTSEGSDGIILHGCQGDGSWNRVSQESRMSWQITNLTEVAAVAHPEVYGMIVSGSVFVIGIYSETKSITRAVQVSDSEDADRCGAGKDFFSNEPFFKDGVGYRAESELISSITQCRSFPLSGELSCEDVGSGDALLCVGTTSTNDTGLFEGAQNVAVSVAKTVQITTRSVPYLLVPLEAYVRSNY